MLRPFGAAHKRGALHVFPNLAGFARNIWTNCTLIGSNGNAPNESAPFKTPQSKAASVGGLFASCGLPRSKSGRTSAPRPPQPRQTNRGSRSESLTLSGQRSASRATWWPQWQ